MHAWGGDREVGYLVPCHQCLGLKKKNSTPYLMSKLLTVLAFNDGEKMVGEVHTLGGKYYLYLQSV